MRRVADGCTWRGGADGDDGDFPLVVSRWDTREMNTTHAVKLGDRGRLVIPAELRTHQSWHQGTPLVIVETEAGVIMASRDQMKSLVRRQLTGESLVAELVAERRVSASAEDDA